MKQDYNSRQRKIYKDYNIYSTDNLLDIIKKRNEYIPEVIHVINDILSERNAIYPIADQEILNKNDIYQYGTIINEKDVSLIDKEYKNEESIKSFAEKLKEKSGRELREIITRYTGYQPETVTAALFVSVEKGLISYDLKERLSEQIEKNLASHTKHLKQYYWETNNAFKQYISVYQDEEIYDILEDPKGIVIDVYYAVLLVAKERELISETDFANYFKDAKAALKSDVEIRMDEIKEYFTEPDPLSDPENVAELEKEVEKFWKCPKCGELVGMEFGVCWNCQTEIPAMIIHPGKEEILTDRVREKIFTPIKTGFILIGGGLVVTILTYIQYSTYKFVSYHYSPRFWMGILMILAGFGFIIFGLFFKSRTEDQKLPDTNNK
jgi:acetone carboxylase gamma subunit